MFKIYKFVIYVTLLLILTSFVSVTLTFTCLFILALIYYDFEWTTDFEQHGVNKVSKLYFAVKPSKRTNFDFKFHSTPIMQNKHSDSRYLQNGSILSPIRNSPNGLVKNRLPSTPTAISPAFWQANDNIVTTPIRNRKYSLSEVTTPKSTPERTRHSTIQTIAGPLLASTRFNVNLSTYTDLKSPGLSGRIVQYNKEANTHQSKYGNPGLFPIVHLHKKELPVISPKSKQVTVRLATPSLYSPVEDSQILLGGISQEKLSNSDVSTRSVLDALKEISRKRIHTDDNDSEEIVKRQRKECLNGEYSKRMREESPQFNTVTSATKKICVVDAVTASYTSYQLFMDQLEKGTKRKAKLAKQKKQVKQRKLTNAETQTIEVEKPKIVLEKKDERTEVVKPLTPEKIPLKIFDEKPLELKRKHKLATLLQAMTGESAFLMDHPSIDFTDSVPKTESRLVSIISPQNKMKHNKHVTFNIPDKESTIVTDGNSPPTTSKLNTTGGANTMTTATLFSPISSVVATNTKNSETNVLIMKPFNEAPEISTQEPKLRTEEKMTESSIVQPLPATLTTNTSFLSPVPAMLSVSTACMTAAATAPVIATPSLFNFTPPPMKSMPETKLLFGSEAPTFNFGKSNDKPTTPPKMGGFKFDLKSAASTPTSVASKPTFAFGTPTTTTSPFAMAKPSFGSSEAGFVKPSTAVLSIGNSNVAKSPIRKPETNNTNMFAMTPSTTMFGTIMNNNATKTFDFGAKKPLETIKEIPDTSTNQFGPATFTTTAAPLLTAGNTKSNSVFGNSIHSSTKFTTNVSNFGTTSASASPAFGTATSLNFGSTPTPAFGTTTTPAFGTTTTPAFGTTPTPAFGATTTTSAFGATTSNPAFGPASAPAFGTPTPLGFGTTSAPAFGNTTTLSFGTTTAPSFGTTTAPSFGATTPAFGVTVTPNFSTTTAFGTTTAPTFVTTAPSFGASAPGFGLTVPSFGTSTTTSSGFSSSSFLAKPSPNFGSTTTAPFAASTTTNSKFAFGASAQPTSSFGTPVTTSASFVSNSSTFNNSSTAPFGANSAQPGSFGATQGFSAAKSSPGNIFAANNNAFGSNGNAFGGGGFGTVVTTASPFPANAFGNFNDSSVKTGFGNNDMNFPKPQSDTNIFANSNANSFGSGNTSEFNNLGPSTTTVLKFGTTTSAVPTPPFGSSLTSAPPSFGSGSATATPTFGAAGLPGPVIPSFGSSGPPASAVPSFSSSVSTAPAFGSSAPTAQVQPTFGGFGNQPAATATQANIFQFGSNTTGGQANVFSFGSGDASKASTGFNFAAAPESNAPAFPSLTPNFNAPAAGFGNAAASFTAAQFATPTVGMFSIGSGSVQTPKSRNQLKARRRT